MSQPSSNTFRNSLLSFMAGHLPRVRRSPLLPLSLSFCLALLRYLDAELELEFPALKASHQRRAVANRIAHPCTVHASDEFIENLLSLVRAKASELSS